MKPVKEGLHFIMTDLNAHSKEILAIWRMISPCKTNKTDVFSTRCSNFKIHCFLNRWKQSTVHLCASGLAIPLKDAE
jgi:hypothetical protein